MNTRPLRIMVPVDPTRPASPAIDVAVGLRPTSSLIELVAATTEGLDGPVVDTFLAGERDRQADARVDTRRIEGTSVVDALLAHIARTTPDLVVLDSHGRGLVGELVLGSVSADLVRSSPVPTLLVGPACDSPAPIERFVVAVDGSTDSLEALDVAMELAERLAVPVELIEVSSGDLPASADVTETAELHRIAAAVDPPVRSWDVLHGDDVARSLVDHAAAFEGAVLVIGTHGRSPGRPRVLGGVATRSVRHATVPVLVVSPEAASRTEHRHVVGASGSDQSQE